MLVRFKRASTTKNWKYLEWFGMDWHAPTLTDNGLPIAEVWDLDVPFNDDVLQNLTGNVNPLRYV